jgi:hypothetical protein
MKKKKTRASSKTKVLPHEKNKKESIIAAAKEKDFGGIPDIDPKKFLGCG